MEQHQEGHMKALLTFATPMVGLSVYMIYWYLLQIEINKTMNLPTGLESVGSHDDFARKKKMQGLEEEPDQPAQSEPAEAAVPVVEEQDRPRRWRITTLRNVVLLLLSLALSLLTYLLLVVSSANFLLSLLGVACVVGISLAQQIGEELRRQRTDRIAAIVTFIFFAASFMSLATYANMSIQQGEIYEGKARIIGFDSEDFDNSKGDGITRSNLEVAWGGEWGCPQVDGKQCTARVKGAMCESEEEDDDKRRFLSNNFGRFLNNNNNKNDENNGAGDDALAEEEQENEDLEEDLEDEEEEVQEEEEEVEEEEEENEELEEEVEEYEEYAEELEEDVIDMEENGYTYYYDDDLYEDSYWDDQDWGSVWGEYACYDLFDYDMSGSTYNADEKPGDDDWPFINIYGNCKTCDAYIVDYWSTEHYQQLYSYKTQGRNYLIFSFLGLGLTALLHFKHRMDPIAEGELELLPHDGGAMA